MKFLARTLTLCVRTLTLCVLLGFTGARAESSCIALVVVGMEDERAIAAGDDAVVVVGTANASRLRDRLASVDVSRVRAVFSFGVAGALDPELEPGTLLMSEQVISQVKDDVQKTVEINWPVDANLLASASLQARRAGISFRRGVFLGTDTEARDQNPDVVATLFDTSGAHLIDNESHLAAQFASEHGLPFLAIRAVGDSVYNPLPEAALLPLDPEDGSPDGWAIAKSLVKNPLQIPRLIGAAFHYHQAAESLRQFRSEIGFRKLSGANPGACRFAGAP